MITLVDFIPARRAEIKARESELTELLQSVTEELGKLRLELSALDAAESRFTSPPPKPEPVTAEWVEKVLAEINVPVTGRRHDVSIQDMARQVLALSPAPLTIAEVNSAINSRFNVQVARASLSPQLSRLRRKGVVRIESNKWVFVGPNENAPTVRTEEASLV
jgi:hypothetical protein